MTDKAVSAFVATSSQVVAKCQICDYQELEPILFLGYLPPVNKMRRIGERPCEEESYPAQLLYCPRCHLVQLGLIVSARVLFPPEYPYTSSTTRILRDNFAELYRESSCLIPLSGQDLIIDIGSNDGNLLNNFKDRHRVLGITPEEIGKIAIERGIPTVIDYFNRIVARKVVAQYGQAKVVTATNVFAHIGDVHEVLDSVLELLIDDGVFISESHYLLSLLETLQYDTIYHEHLRYYSLHSLNYLLQMHGMEIFHAKRIPTHGGSIRVYASRKGKKKVLDSVARLLELEKPMALEKKSLLAFREQVVLSKLKLLALLEKIKKEGKKIYGISAPSRASTLINYTGIDDGIVDYVVEVQGSHKIGKYIPGTLIPVVVEEKLLEDQPDYALLFSWHIADELIPKLKEKGFRGNFILPLPKPQIVESGR